MSFGSVRTTHAIWLDRVRFVTTLLGKLLVLAIGCAIAYLGMIFNQEGVIVIGGLFTFITLILFGITYREDRHATRN